MNIENTLPKPEKWAWISNFLNGPAQTSKNESKRPEIIIFMVLIVVFNIPTLYGSAAQSFLFDPTAVQEGQWWRLLTHPFVHVTWYHVLLDGLAFLALYAGLLDKSLSRRMGYIVAGAMGSLCGSWLFCPTIDISGLCGLSGIAHGLMAVSAVEMIEEFESGTSQWWWGWISFVLVIGKGAIEGITGHMLFTFWDFGMVGSPVAASHPGGIIGSLLVLLVFKAAARLSRPAPLA